MYVSIHCVIDYFEHNTCSSESQIYINKVTIQVHLCTVVDPINQIQWTSCTCNCSIVDFVYFTYKKIIHTKCTIGTGTACNTSSKWVIAVQCLMSNFSGITMAKTSYIRQNGNDVHFELDQQAYMISWTFIVLHSVAH